MQNVWLCQAFSTKMGATQFPSLRGANSYIIYLKIICVLYRFIENIVYRHSCPRAERICDYTLLPGKIICRRVFCSVYDSSLL